MPADCIPLQQTRFLTDLIKDYLIRQPAVENLYGRFPELLQFDLQLAEKKESFSAEIRKILVTVLQEQYSALTTSEQTAANIASLTSENTFTVTTGHQLNLFGGPLYFIYKIISTIKLARELEKAHPDKKIVPIFWMATEDHDFEEINYFHFDHKKISWNSSASGAVGHFSTEGLENTFEVFKSCSGRSKNALQLQQLFEEAYIKHHNLADATRYLVNALFGETGLVVIDANEVKLKSLFATVVKKELLHSPTFDKVSETVKKIEAAGYHIQVNPRKINLFYLTESHRGRIEKDVQKSLYFVEGTSLKFTEAEILKTLHDHPERFSPNVMLRPVYQELILPNLCYIGGGGELAYWLQLKSTFAHFGIPFPILLHRNAALVVPEKVSEKLEKIELTVSDLFLRREELIDKKIRQISDIPIDFTIQKNHLKAQFKALYDIAEKTDASFLGAVRAQEAKQIKGLEKLEKRLLKAQKRKLQDEVNRLEKLQESLFPSGSLQERHDNFSEYYLQYGEAFIENAMDMFNPLQPCFDVIRL
ncbi:MAG: bacillithiol biosynthesis cysteine-adding enzyme BshC [Flavobacteriaceae bacterium]|nr:bacillithiol biosynthesis cysteine-adding enzyme BshC [Flavobacteriaceae bacterium]